MPEPLHPDLQALVGSWRLLSLGSTFTDTGEREEIFGPTPLGRMILEPGGRAMFLFAHPNREPASDDAGRAALLRSMMAYTGTVRWGGPGRFITTVEITWLPEWSGELERFFTLEGDRLTITSGEYAPPRAPHRRAIGDVVLLRE